MDPLKFVWLGYAFGALHCFLVLMTVYLLFFNAGDPPLGAW
jgi:hypothetical protein